MGNMSYCRFENTAQDLEDCLKAIDNEETNDLSDYEIEGLEKLLLYAKHIIELEYEIEDIIENNKK
jgi:hypothetical protein